MTHIINPIQIITQTIESTKIDLDHAIWYVMYCYAFSDFNEDKTENHHILPRKSFPEYKNLNLNSWNSAKLPKRNHIIAHYILTKAIKIQSTLAAFNMMKRALKHIDDIVELSILYEEYRESFSEMFSKINKGRKPSLETRNKLSIAATGEVPVYDPNFPEHMFRVSVNDPRYLSGELVHNKTGSTHKDSTKQLMSENGSKNKIRIYDAANTDTSMYIPTTESIPEGYLKGDPKQIELAKNRFTEAAHWYNPITKQEYRLKPDGNVPEGAIKGRNPNVNNPFTGIAFHKNFKTNEIIPTNETIFAMYCGNPKATNAFIFEGKITFSLDTLLQHFPTKINKSTAHKLIYQKADSKIFHYKTASDIRDYLSQFTNYNEIPLQILPISEVVDLITESNWLQ